VGTLTVLFSDLTGSTALYERLGDARAFALVQEHFRDMMAAIARHEGAIVKTMGDAVMATFESPVTALRAALEMVREAERAHAREGLSVKLGLHEGPCLAVRANERLDFFGTTVNVAARLQAQAHGSQVVVMEDLLAHPEIAAIVRERALPVTRFDAHLKGIREAQHLVALDATTGPAAGELGPRPSDTESEAETASVPAAGAGG
jgi:class 3 adenylate cyclase